MNNPFDVLRKKREAEAAERLKASEAKLLAEKELNKTKTKVFRYFDDLVTHHSPMIEIVLKQLLEAQYPDLELRCPYDVQEKNALEQYFYRDKWRPRWSIGRKVKIDPADYMTTTDWVDFVSVNIDVDQKKYPFFICFAKEREKQCKLSETELVKTLLVLHR